MNDAEEKKLYKSESFRLFFKTMIRVFSIFVIFLVFYGAYFMAEQTFSNPAYDAKGTNKIKIVVKSNDSEKDVAQQLEEKKLIYGSYRFRVRKFFSKYKNQAFIPGEYQFTQNQGLDDIMGILCGDDDSKEIRQ
ncbi:hypothetical protein BHF70_01040 [Anaerostipes sp. 494a]|nr:hypothetical protein BHF70_01040 [Anaerostipes sp. 494a]